MALAEKLGVKVEIHHTPLSLVLPILERLKEDQDGLLVRVVAIESVLGRIE